LRSARRSRPQQQEQALPVTFLKLHFGSALSPVPDWRAERRQRLAYQVHRLAHQLANGNRPIVIEELRDIAAICDSQHLPIEAARIRRWMGDPE
jgi:hypothetical protein